MALAHRMVFTERLVMMRTDAEMVLQDRARAVRWMAIDPEFAAACVRDYLNMAVVCRFREGRMRHAVQGAAPLSFFTTERRDSCQQDGQRLTDRT